MEALNILAAAIAGFAVGAVWYMGLSRQWIAASGVRVGADGRPTGGAAPFVVAFVVMLVVAGFMRHVLAGAGIDRPGIGALSGAGFGAFLIAPWIAMCNAYAGRPATLSVIDGGYAVLGCAAIGLVLTLF